MVLHALRRDKAIKRCFGKVFLYSMAGTGDNQKKLKYRRKLRKLKENEKKKVCSKQFDERRSRERFRYDIIFLTAVGGSGHDIKFS
jgi:hypothetical protein